MLKPTDLKYYELNGFKRFLYRVLGFLISIPLGIWHFIKNIGLNIKKIAFAIGRFFKDLVLNFIHGDWKTKISYFIMGFGNIARGQVFKGLLFLAMEVVFIWFMATSGFSYISRLDHLGITETTTIMVPDPLTGLEVAQTIYGENSFDILLYGVLSVFFIIAFVVTWYLNVKQNIIAEKIIKSGKRIKSGKKDLQSVVDDQFHKTLLSIPLAGILVFTVMPIVFMILVAFTNFDKNHQPPFNLFTWIGFDNFELLLSFGSSDAAFATTFFEVLVWTLIWAFFATFTNYFLGMIVAMMINKKGIKFKKVFRTFLVLSIAIPQFISLLYVSKLFDANGVINTTLIKMGLIGKPLPFWTDPMWARVTVIVLNIWIGIPYLMLITTGILMNIPADLYESSKVDGANVWQQYFKITLPYMLFVTGPYLLTSFIANMNNFNVIYLLTKGEPGGIEYAGNAGATDLLVTWLYKMTVDSNNYSVAATIGILVFVVVSVISLVVYNVMPSMKNEEDFS